MIGDWKGLVISLYVRQECGALQMRLGLKTMMKEEDVQKQRLRRRRRGYRLLSLDLMKSLGLPEGWVMKDESKVIPDEQ